MPKGGHVTAARAQLLSDKAEQRLCWGEVLFRGKLHLPFSRCKCRPRHSTAMGSNDLNGTEQDSLQILIVGAGIGGLTAAIALRQQGHRVSVSDPAFSSEFVGNSHASHVHSCSSEAVLRMKSGQQFTSPQMPTVSSYGSGWMRPSSERSKQKWFVFNANQVNEGHMLRSDSFASAQPTGKSFRLFQ